MSNKCKISGILVENVNVSHETKGLKFYKTTIMVERKSGYKDILPLIIPEYLIDENINYEQKYVTVLGQFRSRNEDSHVKMFVFAYELTMNEFPEENDKNFLYINGFLTKPPVFRETPSGRKITELLIVTNRKYRHADYIPCVCWGDNAENAKNYPVGSEIKAVGRIQSREYKKTLPDGTEEMHVTYEASLSKVNDNGQES